MKAAVTMTERQTALPTKASMRKRKLSSPALENREIRAVCSPKTDIMPATRFNILAADNTGLDCFRNFTRSITARLIKRKVYSAER